MSLAWQSHGFYRSLPRPFLLQLIERELECIQKMRYEIVKARQVHFGQGLARLARGGFKFAVARLQLLHALDIGGQLSRSSSGSRPRSFSQLTDSICL